jgi:hypothetical protein
MSCTHSSYSRSRGQGRSHVEDNDGLTMVDDVVGDIDMLLPVEGYPSEEQSDFVHTSPVEGHPSEEHSNPIHSSAGFK